MDSAPLGKVLNEDNEKDEEFIKFRKESLSKKGTVHSIKLERKKTHQGEIRFWKSIKLWEKRESHQARKVFNQKKKREREREKERSECKNFVKLWENTDSSKDIGDIRFHEKSFEMRRMSKNEDSLKAKYNQILEDEEKKK